MDLHFPYSVSLHDIIVFCMILLFCTRGFIGMLFGASAQTCAQVARILPWFLAAMLFLLLVRIVTSYFYATENVEYSYILVFSEPVFQLIILIVLL